MKATVCSTKQRVRYVLTTFALLAICGFLIPQLALAATPAGTAISNTATVNYENSGGVAQPAEQSTTTTTVLLVPAAPTLTFVEFVSTPGSTAQVTANETTGVQIRYRLQSNANGIDTYEYHSIADVNAGVSVATTPAIANIVLGASMTAVGSAIPANTTTVLYLVPDGVDDSINFNIGVGHEIIVNGELRTVSSIDETTDPNYAAVTVGAALSVAPVQGVNVYEAETFVYTVTTGTLSAPPAAGTHAITVQARSTTDTLLTATQNPDPASIQVVRTAMTVTKYVRNVDTGVVGGGGTINVGGNDYYTTGVTGIPTEDLEYLIVIDNTGSGLSQNIVVSDPISPYVTLNAASIQLDPGTGAFAAVNTTVDDGDAAELDAATDTLYVYAGAGGDDSTAGAGNGTGGSLNAGQVSQVLLQVTID